MSTLGWIIMDKTDGFQTLGSLLNISELEDHEKIFVSNISIKSPVKDAYCARQLVCRPCNNNPDFIDEINSSETWKKISSLMGEEEFQKMWKYKLVFFEMPNSVRVSLNGHMSWDDQYSYQENSKNTIRHTVDLSMGYNPLTVVDRKTFIVQRISYGRNVIPVDYESLCGLIKVQENGVPCRDFDISPAEQKMLKRFLKKDFRLTFLKKKLLSNRLQMRELSSVQINPLVKTLLESYVPRGLIGSKKAFDRMTSNICRCLETNLRFPVRLVTLMRGLPSSNFRRNVFLCKFVLFLTNVFVNRVVHKLFHVTESLKDKHVLFFTKNMWTKYENEALRKMIESNVLTASPGVSFGPHVSKLRILYKPKGFRPLVTSSTRLKRMRFCLSLCNTFLKQLLNQIKPGYSHVLNALCSQWRNLTCEKLKQKIYFVRTDVSEAFQSIMHKKLVDVLTRRLSSLDPVQTCRTFEYKCGMRKKSVLHFTKLSSWLHNKTVYCEAGKKVYTTSYLKAVIIQYIKQNYVSFDGRKVFQQIKGLPQDMDDCYFNHLKSKHDILIRGADDYLFLTTDSGKAYTFLQLIREGIPDYGITFQHTKTITNFGSPAQCFTFFGYNFYPLSRRIEPNFSQWDASRMYINPKISFSDLTRRMKTITHTKLHALILDSNYLNKFAVMKNIYLCSKIHASKYKKIHDFLVENGNSRPSLTESYLPIITAVNVISSKVSSVIEDENFLSRREVKIIVLKAFETILGLTGPLKSLVEELRVTTRRLLAAKFVSSRFKKLLRSLVKNV